MNYMTAAKNASVLQKIHIIFRHAGQTNLLNSFKGKIYWFCGNPK